MAGAKKPLGYLNNGLTIVNLYVELLALKNRKAASQRTHITDDTTISRPRTIHIYPWASYPQPASLILMGVREACSFFYGEAGCSGGPAVFRSGKAFGCR